MTTLRDKINDCIQEYHGEKDMAYDPEVLLESIMDEIKDCLSKIIG